MGFCTWNLYHLFLHLCMWFDFPFFFVFHSQKFPFSLYSPVLTTSFRSSHHKGHFLPSRLNNGYGIFDHIVVLQLSPLASFVLLLLQKKGELWLTQYKNRAIKIQIFIMSSSKIQIWRVKAQNYYQCRKICTGKPFNKCCSWLIFHQKIGEDWRGGRWDRTGRKQWLHGRNKRRERSQQQKPEGPVSSDEGQLPETPSNL